jgi:hypothetical protein
MDSSTYNPASQTVAIIGRIHNYGKAIMQTYANYTAPRRFALCRETCNEDTNDPIFSWGVAFDDVAILFNSHGRLAEYSPAPIAH